MKLWCTKIDFPDQCKDTADRLPDKLVQMHCSITEILRYWLGEVTKMAAYYGNIAYGTVSDESKIFNNLLDIWNETCCEDLEKENLVVDFEERHKMTCYNISLLC